MPSADPTAPLTLHDEAGELTATILPGAGMLITSLRHSGEELLGQRRGVEAYLAQGKTMGIPLLYPWANRVGADRFVVPGTPTSIDLVGERPGLRRDPNGLAMHGVLAAEAGWTWSIVDEAAAGPCELHGSFDFAARPDLLASFPFPHQLHYRVALRSGALTLTLEVQAGERSVPIAHGLHPYLTLPGVAREAWQVDLPARTHLTLDDHGLPTGEAATEAAWSGLLGDRTFDDAYDGIAEGAAWVLEGGGRRITTTFEQGYSAAQVFAPSEDAVVCFEPMAAPTNALVSGRSLRVALPGAVDVTRMSIAVQRT